MRKIIPPLLTALLFASPFSSAEESNFLGSDESEQLGQLEQINSSSKKLEEILVTINISDNFVPWPISESTNLNQYFIDAPEKDLQGMGLSYSFDFSKALFYSRLDPSISFAEIVLKPKEVIKSGYVQEKDLKKYNQLLIKQEEGKELTKRELKSLAELKRKITNVRSIQEHLLQEGFLESDADGLFGSRTITAVSKYQSYHRLNTDGTIGSTTAQELNRSSNELIDQEILVFREFFTERLFYATHVINPQELDVLVEHSFQELDLYNKDTFLEIASGLPFELTITLPIPDHYNVAEMDLEIEIRDRKRWDDGKKSMGTLFLYQNYEGERLLLLETKVIMGGKQQVKKKGRKPVLKEFPTPEIKDGCLKRVVVLPYWSKLGQPAWAEDIPEDEINPGPYNAYGLFMGEIYNHCKPMETGYKVRESGDTAFRIHSTRYWKLFKHGASSHGCIRINPPIANHLFPFILYHLPHLESRFVDGKGDIYPLESDHYIHLKIESEK